jgi:hypothetical protein
MNISTPIIRDVGNRFLSIDFPSERIIASLGVELRRRYQDNVLIVNLSERDYDEDQLPGHVLTVNFRGLPAPPLELLCRLCLQIHQWLSRSSANVVAIHCFPGLSRTAVLLCSYLSWCGTYVHPVDALIDVCAGLKIDVESNPILPSQKRYLNYFFDFLTNPVLPAVPARNLTVSKLILNGVPRLPMSEDALFRPFVEIWKDGHLVYTSLPANTKELSVEDLVNSVQGHPIAPDPVSQEETCVAAFTGFGEVVLSGDILFRIRHLTSLGGRFTCLRFAFSTNHVVNNMLHFGQLEIDGNLFNNCMIDVVFGVSATSSTSIVTEEVNQTRDILKRAKETSDKLRQGCDVSETGSDIEEIFLRRKVQAEAPKIGTVSEKATAAVIGKQSPDPLMEKGPESGDDVDDFFAQLEKDAQM